MRRREAGGGADHRGVVGAERDRHQLQRDPCVARRAAATAARSGPLAATPPPSATASHSPRFSARSSFATSWPTAAAWKEAARSARRSATPSGAELPAAVDERRLQAAEAEVEAGVAAHRDRHLERLRVALLGLPSGSPARPGSRGRAGGADLSKASPAASSRVWPSTSWPSWSRTAASSVWPPLATRQRKGGSSGSGSRKLAATWPCRWSTGISGSRRAAAIAFAVLTPTSSAPISPGPAVDGDRLDVVQGDPGLGQRRLDHRRRPARGGGGRRPRGRRRRSAAWAAACEEITLERIRGAVEHGGAGVVAGGLDREDQVAVVTGHSIQPHDQRVLAVVVVVAGTDAGGAEAETFVHPDRARGWRRGPRA